MSAGFTSDEEYDKIAYSKEDSKEVDWSANTGWTDYEEQVYTYAHGLGEQPLIDVIFSLDGTNYYGSGETIYDGEVAGTGGAGYWYVTGFGDADSTNVYVILGSNKVDPDTVYFKVTAEYKQ